MYQVNNQINCPVIKRVILSPNKNNTPNDNEAFSAAHCFWDVIKETAYPPEEYGVAAGKFLRSWDMEKDTNTGVQKKEVGAI